MKPPPPPREDSDFEDVKGDEQSSSGGSSTSGSNINGSSKTEEAPLVNQETKAVNRSKKLVYLALLLAAAAVGTLTWCKFALNRSIGHMCRHLLTSPSDFIL